MTDRTVEDLLGEPRATKIPPRRAHNSPPEELGDAVELGKGVSIQWLMRAFKMDRDTVKKRLLECPVLKKGPSGTPLYDFPMAASYLVKPRVDLKKYIASLRTQDLPVHLQKEYWAAQNGRQKWEENAGDLWRTATVQETLSDTFKHMKMTMQLWVSDLGYDNDLPPKLRAALEQRVDALQNELHQRLVEALKDKKARSTVAELEDMEVE